MLFAVEKDDWNIAAPWAWEQPLDWETLQPLPFEYSRRFRPKCLIDNPEGKRILPTAVFKDG